jgi:hypothetical protein
MKKTKRFLPATLIALTMAAVLTTLLLAACEQAGSPSAAEQPAAKPPGSDPSSPGTETETKLGSITVTVAAAGDPSSGQSQSVAASLSIAAAAPQSVARTVVPVIEASVFDTIEVTFTPSKGDPISKPMTKVTETFYLPPGTYDLTVTGKKGGNSIAVGGTTSVVIDDTEETVKATVYLKPETGESLAVGTFNYDVTIPSVNVATLTLIKKPSNDKVKDFDLTQKSTPEDLPPGEYRLKVFLETEEGNGEIAGLSGEVVYIYSTLTSTFTRTFSETDFIKTKGPLNLTISFGPTTIATADNALTFVQGADSTFTLTVSATDFTGVAWNLDGTELTEVADGVNGNTYTAPNTLKPGTHFMTVTAQSTANNANYSEIVQFTVEKQ